MNRRAQKPDVSTHTPTSICAACTACICMAWHASCLHAYVKLAGKNVSCTRLMHCSCTALGHGPGLGYDMRMYYVHTQHDVDVDDVMHVVYVRIRIRYIIIILVRVMHAHELELAGGTISQ